ncbi:MAG: hypothetical protein M1836_005903 [Candelina mexicana]|nr:MAG: hypothetical protein M1836_005903 [Candelina mexicana]
MPHAENQKMGEATVNGEKPSSAFISHLTSYPVVSDSISTFKSNPYGQKSLDLADHGYATFAKPVIPYLARPYSMVSPYVAKADSLADSSLKKVDQTFPIVKEDTDKIKATAVDTAFFPLRKATEGKDYVLETYNNQYKKCGGRGLITTGKASVSTSLVVTSDVLAWISNYLGSAKDQTKEKVNEKANN